MKIVSRWKLTHDPNGSPTVILNLGDLIDDELDFDLKRSVQVRPLAAAPAPFIRMGGNNMYVFEFSRFLAQPTDAEAREEMCDLMVSMDDLPKKPLRLQIGNEEGLITGFYYQWANAAVRGARIKRDLDSSRARWGTRYSIVATKFTRTNL